MIVSQPTLEPLRRWDPDQIGPYALIGRLGAGAMGQVYLGRSTAGRLVAVKTIKIDLAEEPGFRIRFAREVAAARRVSGVFTAAVVAANPEAEMPWLATAYVPAPSLSRLVRVCGPLPVPTVRWLAAGCAEALESIHLAGLVHRDLKPSNVLVAPDGPRVIDFGVARAAERIQLTVTRGAVGTPAYMAPEQARDSQHASLASDVYSLGATLLFAATGHGPYQGETVMDVLVKLATEPPDLAGLPPDLASLVMACLERSPRMRPTSAALLAGLGSFVEASADPADAHSYLPDSAMALIGEYQRSPQPAAAHRARTRQRGPDLGVPHGPPGVVHPAREPPAAQRDPAESRGPTARRWPFPATAQPRSTRGQRTRAALIASGVLVGAAALVIGGAVAGPRLFPSLSGASQLAPPPGADPPPSPAGGTSDTPKLTMGQPEGDSVHRFPDSRQRIRPADSCVGSAGRLRDGRSSSRWSTPREPSTSRSTRTTTSSGTASRSGRTTSWPRTPTECSRPAPSSRCCPAQRNPPPAPAAAGPPPTAPPPQALGPSPVTAPRPRRAA